MDDVSETTDNGSYRITIHCESDGYPEYGNRRPARIEIDLGETEKDYVGDIAFHSRIRLFAADQSFEWLGLIYAYSLKYFADELDRMHTSLTGSVRLYDWDGETLLCLTVIHSARGQIALGGRFEAAILWTNIVSEDRFVEPKRSGVVTSFEGFLLDQSFLPPIVHAIRRFLGDDDLKPTCLLSR